MELEIRLTDRSKADIEDIAEYLALHWSQKTKMEFLLSLHERITLIGRMPYLYRCTQTGKDIRESVLNKHTIIYYKIVNEKFISILTIRNTSRDHA